MATYYKAKVFYPEVYDTWEIELDEKEYAEYRKAVDAARKEFLEEYPEDADNEEGWNQWLEETLTQEYDFKYEFWNGFILQEADVLWIDLDHPIEKPRPEPILLTKSRYTAFRQCPKCLWMKINKPEEAVEEAIPESRIKAGIEVGNLAKTYFGTYHEATKRRADGSLDIAAMLEETQRLMADPSVETICEAAFEANGCYCAVDLLHREKGGWAIYEVKSSTAKDYESDLDDENETKKKKEKKPDEVYIWDVSFQKYVLKKCGIDVTGTYLMQLDKHYILDGDLDIKQLFNIYDMAKLVDAESPKMADSVELAKRELILAYESADLNNGCNKPYPCPFKAYCMEQHHVPTPSVFDLYGMQWRTALKCFKRGVASFEDILADKEFCNKENKQNEIQRIQIESTLHNVDIIDKAKIRAFLAGLKYPIYHLDFETIQPTIPEYQGTHPYQQIPTQYSLHIQHSEFDTCEHFEFLADAHSANPMREVAEQLCKDIPMDVTVMVFNDNFEKSRLKEMAKAFPDLSNHLLAIRENIVDLLDPFRDGAYYRPAMDGSFSIKKVLPALFPDDPTLNYHKLPGCVHNGGEAMEIFPKMKDMSPEKEAQTRKDLLQYCALDTWSMVVILKELYRVSK